MTKKKNNFPTFKYDISKVLDYSHKFNNPQKQIDYLLYAKREKLLNAQNIDLYSGEPSFETQIDMEIDYLKSCLSYPSIESEVESKSKIINQNKIWWKGSEIQLLHLFDLLFNENLLDVTTYEKRHAVIRDHFINKDGKNFNNKQLSDSQSKNHNKNNKRLNVVESVVSKLNT